MLIQSQTQAEALDRLLKLTWGAFFTSTRRLYTSVAVGWEIRHNLPQGSNLHLVPQALQSLELHNDLAIDCACGSLDTAWV